MEKRKGRIENLKNFPKGVSGNPKGRPKKLPKLDELLAEVLGEEQNGVSAAKAILMAQRKKAIAGDVRAAEALLDRAFGKAKNHFDVTSNGETISIVNSMSEEAKQKVKDILENEY